jgi:hypothetical protein
MTNANHEQPAAGFESSRVLRIAPQPVVFRRATVPLKEAAAFQAETLQLVHDALIAIGAPLKAGPYTRTLRIMAQGSVELEAGFPVESPVTDLNGFRSGYLPGGTAIQKLHVGPIEKIGQTQAGMLAEMMPGFRFVQDGPGWVYYLTDPSKVEPEDFRAMVVMPIRERNASAKKLKAVLEALPKAISMPAR